MTYFVRDLGNMFVSVLLHKQARKLRSRDIHYLSNIILLNALFSMIYSIIMIRKSID